jgi:signal transduction histidine kinase
VRFDDRLLTVLNQPAGDRHDAAVRWRQLVDLVARSGPAGSSPVVAEALETIRSQAPHVDENLRAAAARAVAGRPLPLGLLEYFASDQLSVAAPVLAAATLDPGQWKSLLAVADEETRNFVQTLHPEVAAPTAARPTEPAPAEPGPDQSLEPQIEAVAAAVAEGPAPRTPPPPAPAPSLHDVVARIERRRRLRDVQRAGAAAAEAAMPMGTPSLFRWECGPSGEIAWVDGAPRGALIGRTIARVQEDDGDRVDDEVVRAFGMRAPFRDAEMTVSGDGLLAGQWKISGIPAFEPTDGRFAGYRGVALRETPAPVEGEPAADILADPDSLRELVHEIKTPLTAIIGFAEIIEGQYLGPADHRYRQRAGEIVAQARMLLRAIDDLDFAAKIHSSAGAADRRTDLGPLVEQAAASLRQTAAEKDVRIEVAHPPASVIAAVEPELAERLLVRLGSALIDRTDAGERLRIVLDQAGVQCRLAVSRPAGLRNLTDAQLFDAGAGFTEGADGKLSVGFSLRLVRGLARIAGGDLATSAAEFTLLFPRA